MLVHRLAIYAQFGLLILAGLVRGEKSTVCPAVCEEEKCPNIGPIKVKDCPQVYLVKDRCGCCTKCEITHITTTVSPHRRDEVCDKFKCPKKRLCVLNMQGLPVCKCPSEDLCRKVLSRRSAKKSKVCGSDGNIYPTRCHLKVASCHADKKIRVVSKSLCSELSSTNSSSSAYSAQFQALQQTLNRANLQRGDATLPNKGSVKREQKRGRKREGRRLAKKIRRKQQKQDYSRSRLQPAADKLR